MLVYGTLDHKVLNSSKASNWKFAHKTSPISSIRNVITGGERVALELPKKTTEWKLN